MGWATAITVGLEALKVYLGIRKDKAEKKEAESKSPEAEDK